MRRPAPPEPSEVVELDYGSAETPSASGTQQDVRANEVEAEAATAVAAPMKAGVRGRKILAYDTDALDDHAPATSSSTGADKALSASQEFLNGGSLLSTHGNAAAGPSSSNQHHAESLRQQENAVGGADAGVPLNAGLWLSESAQHLSSSPPPPPPPNYPPPALPQISEQHGSAHHTYDPSAPEFHPSLQSHAQTEPELYHPAYHAAPEDTYARWAASQSTASLYDPPYDPQAPFHAFPYGRPPHDYLHTPYPPPLPPPTPPSYLGHYPPTVDNPWAGRSYPAMAHHRDKQLLLKQKKREKKLRKREQKQAARKAAYAANHPSYDLPPSLTDANVSTYDEGSVWIEDGKAQAVAMIKELDARGVPPQRLTERGVPLRMVEDCCVELGISAQGEVRQEERMPMQQATSAFDDAETKPEESTTTPAEDELLAKQQQGITLTPLEELRKKVLASRLAKATAASSAAAASPTASSFPSAASSVFERTATSGEADTLLSQIGESIRSLIRPSQETWAAAQPEDPVQDVPAQSAGSFARKRAYHDVDAVDHQDASAVIDYSGGADVPVTNPSRRQRISYADTFSRAAEMPSGEVDFTAPVPDLADLTESVAESSRVSDSVSRRRRLVAADFDTSEYAPQYARPDRFVDVPSGLNTVVDLSDDDTEEDEIDALDETSGWTRLDVDMRDVSLLRQKTASEHYDNFCALNGIKPGGRAVTPLQDRAAKAVETADGSTPGSVSKENLLAQVAASSAAPVGSTTPSREDLLRKELEIKQLMRKIQMMEERKSKQQAATPSPSVSPMPSRFLAPGNGVQGHAIHTAPPLMPSEFGGQLAASVQNGSGSLATTTDKLTLETSISQPQSVATSGNGGVRLAPALQKQRETLLALLASKRKNASAGSSETAAVKRVDEDEGTADLSKRQDSNGVSASSGNWVKDSNGELQLEQNEVSLACSALFLSRQTSRFFASIDVHLVPLNPSVIAFGHQISPPPPPVSRYRPLVPSLFQSVG